MIKKDVWLVDTDWTVWVSRRFCFAREREIMQGRRGIVFNCVVDNRARARRVK